MYIVGIDVGGTNTDAALLHKDQVLAMAKVPTEHNNLFASTKSALQEVLQDHSSSEPIRLQLSTTLSTNTIVEGRGSPAAILAVPGPGVNLSTLNFPFMIYELDGYIDHRGREVAPLNREQLRDLQKELAENLALGVVGKFSQRNPSHEQEIAKLLADNGRSAISLGHRLSGRANFPRRIVTTYLNASVAQEQEKFAQMWEELLAHLSFQIEEILILKADGGTMPLQDSLVRPIETILSGPAASIMGAAALSNLPHQNLLMVDIGGTTTDLAVQVEGGLLFERNGATIMGFKTLVPALLTRSIGLGGDSELQFLEPEGKIKIGPRRAGKPVCLGGENLTPTDAAVALGLTNLGSQGKSREALAKWGTELNMGWEKIAQMVMESFGEQLTEAVDKLYGELENVPLYTISEVLHPPQVRPQAVVGLGAPASVLIPKLAKKLNLPHEILPFSAGANAVGAAAAQATIGITLHGDTELGQVTIPEMGYKGNMDKRQIFDQERARMLAEIKTREHAKNRGYYADGQLYVVEEEQFNMVRGFRTVGKTFMVRTQLRPQVVKIKGGQIHA